VGTISRPTDQKGLGLIVEAIEEMMALDLQLIVLGTRQKKYYELFQ
jgi:starch synthase